MREKQNSLKSSQKLIQILFQYSIIRIQCQNIYNFSHHVEKLPPTQIKILLIQSLQTVNCSFIPTQYDQSGCKGPTQKSTVKRQEYKYLQYPCPIGQYGCQKDDGIFECEQCCVEYNEIGTGNPNCQVSQFCSQDYTCKNIIESEYFKNSCQSDLDCFQLTCINNYCQSCQDQQIYNDQFICIEGQIYKSNTNTNMVINMPASIIFGALCIIAVIVVIIL